MTLSSATTPGQSGPRSNGIEGLLHIPQISKAGVSPSDRFVSNPGYRRPKVDFKTCYFKIVANLNTKQFHRCLISMIWKEKHVQKF